MQCYSPIHIKNEGAESLRKPWRTVPCGKCPACVANKASQWYTRLLMQQRYSDNAVFVTLTYADENLPPVRWDEEGNWNIDVSKDDIRLYHYRLRKALGPEKSKRLKYFLVSEYGPSPTGVSVYGAINRPHYHVIYFNLDKCDYHEVTKAWNKGFTEFGDLTEGRVRYVSGYVIEKNFTPIGRLRPFTFISNGIGRDYVDRVGSYNRGNLDRVYVPYHGKRLPMPRYYKEKLFTEFECKAFNQMCEERSEDLYNSDLVKFGGDVDALENRYTEIRKDFMRKQYQKRRKKKNG